MTASEEFPINRRRQEMAAMAFPEAMERIFEHGFPINRRRQEMAALNSRDQTAQSPERGFQSIDAAKKWRPAMAELKKAEKKEKFPINRRRQEMAAHLATLIYAMNIKDVSNQ